MKPRVADRYGRSGNRVESARVIWVAVKNAPRCQPAAFEYSMALDRFARVVRAARVEAAISAEQRSQRVLIAAQQEYEQGSHRALGFRNASRSSAASRPRPHRPDRSHRPRKRRTISNLSISGRRLRTASRKPRLTQLRSTARLRCCFPITNPTRPNAPEDGITSNWRCRPSTRRPSRNSLAKAAVPVSRCRRLEPIVTKGTPWQP